MTKILRTILLLQIFIVLSAFSYAQKYGITTRFLDNGLEVIVIENHSVPLVTIELDVNAFNSCFDANKYKDQIQADFDLGLEMGVTGTPSAFVNGVKVGEIGKVPTFQDIAVAVDAIVNTTQ